MNDHCRTRAFGVTIEGPNFSIWYGDRSLQVVSKAVHIEAVSEVLVSSRPQYS